ncbi:MAG: N,N-dimethylformamidase beta subunit family domain-containing protein [Acidimicrobiales bacterium]
MVAENMKKGTPSWEIPATNQPGVIQGFSSTTYAAEGDAVDLYVSTAAPSYSVVAYRMGYYRGAGGRAVWGSKQLPGVIQPACRFAAGINMVSCANWSLSTTIDITKAFVPGDYLLKLTTSTGQSSYVLLTIWDPASTATYLVVGRSLTEAGWNTYGGYSFYQGLGPCTLGSGSYPVCNRARVASLDRPFDSGDGSSDFLSNEYPLVRFAEQHGLDVTYVTDITINARPATVLQHRAILSLGHDETWTYNERAAVQSAMNAGVNVIYFGAASVLRHARLEPSPLGVDRLVVDYRDPTEDPLKGDLDNITGNTFDSPPTDLPPAAMTGEVYAGYIPPGGTAQPFAVANSGSWFFKGTGLLNGSEVPGVIQSDIDHQITGPLDPPTLQILGHSPVPLGDVYTNQGKWSGFTYADTVYWTAPTSEAGVFDSGTVNWINMLAPCSGQSSCATPLMDRMTGNLLWLFGQGAAGKIIPAVPNASTITPVGS